MMVIEEACPRKSPIVLEIPETLDLA